MILDELNGEIMRNFKSKGWLPLLDVERPPPPALIREFYSNFSAHSDDSNTQYVRSWIRGEEYVITPSIVATALGVPLVQQPMYTYTETPLLDDIMSLPTDSSIRWGTNPWITSHELTELNYQFFQISCHSIWPIFQLHIIPLEGCAFLYALITNTPINFPSFFY